MTTRYSIGFSDAGLQYIAELLKTRPLAEALDLFVDIKSQVEAQDAQRADAEREAMRSSIRAEEKPSANNLLEGARRAVENAAGRDVG